MTIFFTSDTHFDHKNIIKHCSRPFSSVDEMNETIIRNWNQDVGVQDTVYHLGDFAWFNAANFAKRLNGNIHMLWGNHDRGSKQARDSFFRTYNGIIELRFGDKFVIGCHYPMLSWNGSFHGSWHIHGHVHSSHTRQIDIKMPNSYDVGMDNNNFRLVSFDELSIKISKQIIISTEFKQRIIESTSN